MQASLSVPLANCACHHTCPSLGGRFLKQAPPACRTSLFLSPGCKNLVGVSCALTYGVCHLGGCDFKVKKSGKQVKINGPTSKKESGLVTCAMGAEREGNS